MTPGRTTLADLAAYEAKKRAAVCTTYRSCSVCGMGPPSSGGITVASTLGILENFALEQLKPTDVDLYGGKPTLMGVHLVAEANRLAYADRKGDVVSMTTTVESGFGSWHMARGFILNNQLTDFSINPTDGAGLPVANRVAAGKRPGSSMAPTLVFKQADDGSIGDFVMGTGSPGGATIIQYVVKTLVGVLDWGLDAQQATSMVDFGAGNSATTNLGGEHPNINTANGGADDPLITGLRALGHTVTAAAQSSGISTIVRISRDDGRPAWAGGADPRREGLVLGDGY